MTSRRHTEWRAWLKGFWLLVGTVVGLLWGAALVYRLTPADPKLHDFVQEWTSARNHFTGHPVYMDLAEAIRLHLGGEASGLVEVNAHPPPAVLLILPLAHLGYHDALLTWNLLSLAALVVSLVLVMRAPGLDYSAWTTLPIATILLTSNSLAQQVNQGQLNLALLLLMTLAWLAIRDHRDDLSGGLIGLAAAIKLFPAFLGLYFLVRRQWTGALAAAASFLLVNALTAVVLGWEAYAAYVQDVLPRLGPFRDFWMNASLAGFWHKLFDGSSGHVVPLWRSPALAKALTLVTSIGVAALAGRAAARADTLRARDHAFGLCVIAMLLVSPVTWDHYFLLLVLPLAIMWKSAERSAKVFLACAIVVLGTVNLRWVVDLTIPGDGELAPGLGLTPSVALPVHTVTVISLQFYALMALFIFALLSAGARNRSAPSAADARS